MCHVETVRRVLTCLAHVEEVKIPGLSSTHKWAAFTQQLRRKLSKYLTTPDSRLRHTFKNSHDSLCRNYGIPVMLQSEDQLQNIFVKSIRDTKSVGSGKVT
jgi:hypothetical protein